MGHKHVFPLGTLAQVQPFRQDDAGKKHTAH